MPLEKYKKKRNLQKSKEPLARVKKTKSKKRIFVIQKHQARNLHYDLRLEMEGVLKSWAIPKGPSMDSSKKRLAVQVEDHPYAYKDFEGVIPEGYGKGAVIIWDQGEYLLEEKTKDAIHITLMGKRLKGGFSLIRFKGKNWLLIKRKDRYTSKKEITEKTRSIVTRKKLETYLKKLP